MSKYIKLEDLQKFPIRIDHYDKKNGNEHFVYGVESVLEYAEYLPTADVVEVVRCKDCKKWEQYENTSGAGYCHNKKYCFTYGTMLDRKFTPITMPDDYCSYGERREQNEG